MRDMTLEDRVPLQSCCTLPRPRARRRLADRGPVVAEVDQLCRLVDGATADPGRPDPAITKEDEATAAVPVGPVDAAQVRRAGAMSTENREPLVIAVARERPLHSHHELAVRMWPIA